ncbi:MAG: hypothetical protein HGA59_02020 [Chlorobiaceae bacterium]|jgi:hypothetical protein|nr:hypothetical protein [Chlorobiaceae bacterium]NTV16518.1 hypothetical protein [Chlorobiaceae bacterium]
MDRKEYIDNLGRKLKLWDKEIAKLEKKAEKITKRLHQQIDELKQQREHAASKTTALLHSTEDAWQEVRYGAEVAVNNLKKAFRKARAKFK